MMDAPVEPVDEATRRRFEAAWRSGAPEIDAFLPASTSTLLELVIIDLELRWKNSQPACADDYLKRYPSLEPLREDLAEQERTLRAKAKKLPTIPDCDILRELGRGGMGVVYLAKQRSLNRRVAVKTIRHEGRPEDLQRFFHEAEAVARLTHPNIVPIHHIGRDGEVPYFVMEHVEGGTLADRLKEGPLPPLEAAELVETLARAMEYAHQRGIIHRDLKPANIMLPPGSAKITDFGLAKTLGLDSRMTQTGNLLGTPSYMAPEQAQGHSSQIATQTDVYALGAILYEALTGRPPFQSDTLMATLDEVCNKEPVPPSKLRLGLARDLETICLTCLQKDPAKRYARAELLADDLARFRSHKPIMARRTGVLGVFTRWCHRNPGLAATLAASVLVVAAITGFASMNVLQERDKFKNERDRAEANLYRSLVAQAGGQLDSRGPEWWWKATDSLAQASSLATPERNPEELRDLYARCLGCYYYSLRVKQTWQGNGKVTRLAISKDGKLAAVAYADSRIEVRNVADGVVIHRFTSIDGSVIGLAFDPDNRSLYCGTGTGWIQFPIGDKPSDIRSSHIPSTTAMSVSADGSRLLIGSESGEIIEYDTRASSIDRVIFKADGPILSLAHSPKGDEIAISDKSKILRAITPDGKEIWQKQTLNPMIALRYSPGGERLVCTDPLAFGFAVVGGADHAFEHYQQLHDNSVRRVFVLERGIMTASFDGSLRIWGREASKPLFQYTASGSRFGPIADAEILPDERGVIVAYQDGSVRLWEIHEPAERSFFGHGNQTVCFAGPRHEAFDGVALFSIPNHSPPKLIELNDRHATRIWAAATSLDGRWLASGDHDGVVKVRDAATLKSQHTFKAADLVWSVAFKPNAPWLAAAYGPITVWNYESGAEVMTFSGHERMGTGVAFHPKLPLLASSGRDGFVRLWNLDTKQLHAEHKSDCFANAIAIDPTGTWLAAAYDDGTVKVWHVSTMAKTLAEPRVLTGHSSPVRAVAFSPDGLLASGAEQGIVMLRDCKRDFCKLVNLQSCTGQVRSLEFSQDGRFLISGNYVSSAVAWDLTAVRKALAAANLDWER